MYTTPIRAFSRLQDDVTSPRDESSCSLRFISTQTLQLFYLAVQGLFIWEVGRYLKIYTGIYIYMQNNLLICLAKLIKSALLISSRGKWTICIFNNQKIKNRCKKQLLSYFLHFLIVKNMSLLTNFPDELSIFSQKGLRIPTRGL